MRYIITVLILLIGFKSFAIIDSANYRVIKTLDQDWLVYSKKYSSYVYYFQKANKNTHIINQWLQVEKYKNYLLSFEATPDLALFINHRLIYQNNSDSTLQVYIPIADFKPYLEEGNTLMTFYSPINKIPLHDVSIVFKSQAKPIIKKVNDFQIKKRIKLNFISPYILMFLLILFFLAILKHKYNKRFVEFMGFKNMLANNWLEDMASIKVFSTPLVIIVILNSLYLSLLTSFAGGTHYLLEIFYLKGSSSLFIQLIISTILFSFLFFLKYFFLLFVGWIFNVYNIIKIQFWEFLKALFKINSLLVGVLLLVISYYKTMQLPVLDSLAIALTIILILVTIRTAFLIIKIGAYRNIYLFSYLCTTEILPLTIIIKIILFRNN